MAKWGLHGTSSTLGTVTRQTGKDGKLLPFSIDNPPQDSQNGKTFDASQSDDA